MDYEPRDGDWIESPDARTRIKIQWKHRDEHWTMTYRRSWWPLRLVLGFGFYCTDADTKCTANLASLVNRKGWKIIQRKEERES